MGARARRSTAPGALAPSAVAPTHVPAHGPTLVRVRGPAPGTREFLANVGREMLAATYWLDPAEAGVSGPLVVRFIGHHARAGAKTRPGEQFIQDERVDDVWPDSGLVSVTTRVRGKDPGEWIVSARVVSPNSPARGARGGPGPAAARLYPAVWSWRTWSFRKNVDPSRPVRTCFEPFASVPGIVPLAWGVLAVVGFIVALAVQQAILARVGLPSALAISLIAISAGLVGSQAKFVFDHRRERRVAGWAVQGFNTATAVVGTIAVVVAGFPVGPLLDASAPGLFLGFAIGRIGCFFGGCCGGRPTRSRFGLWSSDQRIGRRRIPTQLFESGLALGIALLALALVRGGSPLHGAVFVAALAGYTLFRQAILRLRAERPPGSDRGATLTAAAAVTVLVADLGHLAATAVWASGAWT